MTLRLRIRIAPRPPLEAGPLLFRGVDTGRVPKAGSLLGSLAGHVLAFGLAIVVCHYVARLHEDDVDWSRYRVEPLRLHLAEPLIFNPQTAGESPKLAAPRRRALAARPAEQAAAAPADSTSRPSVPRRLELPAPRQIATNAPILLQPDFQPQLKPPPADLPPMAFWARQTPAPPKPPAPAEVLVPGRTEALSPAPQLSAPPVLAVPNREPVVADVNVAMPPMQQETPAALPVTNSATMPVRLRDATDSQAASFDRFAGQPVNVMSLASERPDIRDVAIPRGLQNIPRSASGDGTAAGTAVERPGNSASAAGDGQAGDRRTAGSAGTNPGGTETATSRGTTAPATQTPTARAPTAQTPTVAGPRPGSALTRDSVTDASPPKQLTAALPAAPSLPARGGATPGVTRIEHPANGSFDVVVTQSATRDDLSELGGILTGNPVYSVYLPVGDQKEWLLEYCVPAGENVRANAYQVDVDDVGTITPPYPISTVIPNSLLVQPIARHIVLHGFLTAAGILRGVGAAGSNNPLLSEILALLSQWQFRPALRNSRPIDVEILLVIPSHG